MICSIVEFDFTKKRDQMSTYMYILNRQIFNYIKNLLVIFYKAFIVLYLAYQIILLIYEARQNWPILITAAQCNNEYPVMNN